MAAGIEWIRQAISDLPSLFSPSREEEGSCPVTTDEQGEIRFKLTPSRQLECSISCPWMAWQGDPYDHLVASTRCSEDAQIAIRAFQRSLRSPHPLSDHQVNQFRRSFKISKIILKDCYLPPKDTLQKSKERMLGKVKFIEDSQKAKCAAVPLAVAAALLFPPLAPIAAPLALVGVADQAALRAKLDLTKESILTEPDLIWRSEFSARKEQLESAPHSFLLEVEPISRKSRLDPRVRVSEYQWAVTLASYSGWFGQHAKIITEGLEGGCYRMRTYELVRQNSIRERVYRSDQVTEFGQDIWETRTRIWKVPFEKVEHLRALFFDESLQLAKGLAQHKFHYLPTDTKGKGEINCCIWALNLLRQANIAILKKGSFVLRAEISPLIADYTEFLNIANGRSEAKMYDFNITEDVQKEWVSV